MVKPWHYDFNVKSTYTIRFLEGYQANFPYSNWDTLPFWQNRSMTCKTAWLCWCVAFRWWLWLKYNIGQTDIINQKSIGKTIDQKHTLKWEMWKWLIFRKAISVHFSWFSRMTTQQTMPEMLFLKLSRYIFPKRESFVQFLLWKSCCATDQPLLFLLIIIVHPI